MTSLDLYRIAQRAHSFIRRERCSVFASSARRGSSARRAAADRIRHWRRVMTLARAAWRSQSSSHSQRADRYARMIRRVDTESLIGARDFIAAGVACGALPIVTDVESPIDQEIARREESARHAMEAHFHDADDRYHLGLDNMGESI
jgi:hypothetical protein